MGTPRWNLLDVPSPVESFLTSSNQITPSLRSHVAACVIPFDASIRRQSEFAVGENSLPPSFHGEDIVLSLQPPTTKDLSNDSLRPPDPPSPLIHSVSSNPKREEFPARVCFAGHRWFVCAFPSLPSAKLKRASWLPHTHYNYSVAQNDTLL
jgi:hypothetical protein